MLGENDAYIWNLLLIAARPTRPGPRRSIEVGSGTAEGAPKVIICQYSGVAVQTMELNVPVS